MKENIYLCIKTVFLMKIRKSLQITILFNINYKRIYMQKNILLMENKNMSTQNNFINENKKYVQKTILLKKKIGKICAKKYK